MSATTINFPLKAGETLLFPPASVAGASTSSADLYLHVETSGARAERGCMRVKSSVMRIFSRAVSIFTSAIVLLAAGVSASAQKTPSHTSDVYEESSAELTVAPATIKPVKGKFPDSFPFLIRLKTCDATSNPKQVFQDLAGLKAADFDIAVLSGGISIAEGANIMDCQITGQMKIDSTQISTGYAAITVTRKANGTSSAHYFGHAIFNVLDAASSPVPGDASVDAAYSVMGDEMCRKNFGRQVAKSTYCIEVKIGNNSGYPLQLAGVGFRRRHGDAPADISVNLSYRSVRASLQDDSNWGRATIISALDATGLLMGGANPFFHAAYSKTRFTALTALVGTVLPNGLSQIWPDTDQQKMNNLDDEAFRDNLLIANNTQIRTTVFVDRTVMDGIGQQYAKDACTATANEKDKDHPATPAKFESCPAYLKSADWYKSKSRINDPNLVKIALGDLVIVGNLMSYLQRIVVDPAAMATAQAATKTGTLSDPTIADNNTKLSVMVASGTTAPQQVFLSLPDLKNPIAYDRDSSSPTTGLVTYTLKSGIAAPTTGSYELVDDKNQILTNPGVTLQVISAPATQNEKKQ